jgi:UDP-glucose 4-epimerase
VTILDDLSTGHEDAVPNGAAFIRGTIRDKAASVLAGRDIEAVLHFAASSQVGESVANPAQYWANNLGGTLALLDAMRLAGTGRIIFSSTAAVYGEPERTPVEETCSTRPTSPYGASKLAVDTALTEFARLHGFGAVSVRYFNVAGAEQAADGSWLRERHSPESHRDIPVTVAPRRPGDPAILVASARRIQSDLGWHARGDLRAMVADAWQATQAQFTEAPLDASLCTPARRHPRRAGAPKSGETLDRALDGDGLSGGHGRGVRDRIPDDVHATGVGQRPGVELHIAIGQRG